MKEKEIHAFFEKLFYENPKRFESKEFKALEKSYFETFSREGRIRLINCAEVAMAFELQKTAFTLGFKCALELQKETNV